VCLIKQKAIKCETVKYNPAFLHHRQKLMICQLQASAFLTLEIKLAVLFGWGTK